MKVRWTAKAESELWQAVRHIASDNQSAALEIYDRVMRQTKSLEDHPFRGRPGRQPDTRELVIVLTPYLVVYRVGPGGVSIARVLHGAQRWPPRRAR